jgi:hypothetical protein
MKKLTKRAYSKTPLDQYYQAYIKKSFSVNRNVRIAGGCGINFCESMSDFFVNRNCP